MRLALPALLTTLLVQNLAWATPRADNISPACPGIFKYLPTSITSTFIGTLVPKLKVPVDVLSVVPATSRVYLLGNGFSSRGIYRVVVADKSFVLKVYSSENQLMKDLERFKFLQGLEPQLNAEGIFIPKTEHLGGKVLKLSDSQGQVTLELTPTDTDVFHNRFKKRIVPILKRNCQKLAMDGDDFAQCFVDDKNFVELYFHRANVLVDSATQNLVFLDPF